MAITGSTNVTTGDDTDKEWDEKVDYSELLFTQTGKMNNDNASKCSKATNKVGDQQVTTHKHILNQVKGSRINKWWWLLDNKSTVDVCSNGKLFKKTYIRLR